MSDLRRSSPSAERNRQPILDVLERVLPDCGLVLEIASGTGQHAAFFAEHLPNLEWQPSDPSASARESIQAWWHHSGLANLRSPLELDVMAEAWPIDQADGVLNINMIHIAPFAAGVGLMRGAARLLRPGAPLVLYGPYKIDGRHTAPSNAQFDASLRSQDPKWGVRDLEDVIALANEHGFQFEQRVAMPANNFTVIFRRQPDQVH